MMSCLIFWTILFVTGETRTVCFNPELSGNLPEGFYGYTVGSPNGLVYRQSMIPDVYAGGYWTTDD